MLYIERTDKEEQDRKQALEKGKQNLKNKLVN